MDFPIPELVQLTIPDDSDEVRVDAALDAMVDKVLDDTAGPAPPQDPPEQQLYVQYAPLGVSRYAKPDDMITILLTLDPERVAAQAMREARSLYLVEGSLGLQRFFTELTVTVQRYFAEGVNGARPTTLPNASSFGTVAKVTEAGSRLYQAHSDAVEALTAEAVKAVTAIGERAVKMGRTRLEEVRGTIVDEVASYFDFGALGHASAESFLVRETQPSRAFLRGPGMRDLVAAINEVDRDRSAVEQASAAVAASPPQYLNAQFDFEDATKALMSTLEVRCDDHPVLYRIWDQVRLSPDTYFDARGQLLGRPGKGNVSVSALQRQLFQALSAAHHANVGLSADLAPGNVWELSPLIDAALEDLDQAGHTVWYRAAQERLQSEEGMSVASILSMVTGALELGGVFMLAEPPVLLALAVASLVLSLIDATLQFFELRTKDRAYLASLDPQLSWATEPSYVGFYVSIACSLLDLKGVRGALKGVRLADVGREAQEAVDAFRGGVR